LVEHGLRDEQVVEVRGYADRRPRLWHMPDHPRNRRISILVLLRRDDPEDPDADLESRHPLVKRLRKVDTEAQGPQNPVELDPQGELPDPP
jgi:hypothetical protein